MSMALSKKSEAYKRLCDDLNTSPEKEAVESAFSDTTGKVIFVESRLHQKALLEMGFTKLPGSDDTFSMNTSRFSRIVKASATSTTLPERMCRIPDSSAYKELQPGYPGKLRPPDPPKVVPLCTGAPARESTPPVFEFRSGSASDPWLAARVKECSDRVERVNDMARDTWNLFTEEGSGLTLEDMEKMKGHLLFVWNVAGGLVGNKDWMHTFDDGRASLAQHLIHKRVDRFIDDLWHIVAREAHEGPGQYDPKDLDAWRTQETPWPHTATVRSAITMHVEWAKKAGMDDPEQFKGKEVSHDAIKELMSDQSDRIRSRLRSLAEKRGKPLVRKYEVQWMEELLDELYTQIVDMMQTLGETSGIGARPWDNVAMVGVTLYTIFIVVQMIFASLSLSVQGMNGQAAITEAIQTPVTPSTSSLTLGYEAHIDAFNQTVNHLVDKYGVAGETVDDVLANFEAFQARAANAIQDRILAAKTKASMIESLDPKAFDALRRIEQSVSRSIREGATALSQAASLMVDLADRVADPRLDEIAFELQNIFEDMAPSLHTAINEGSRLVKKEHLRLIETGRANLNLLAASEEEIRIRRPSVSSPKLREDMKGYLNALASHHFGRPITSSGKVTKEEAALIDDFLGVEESQLFWSSVARINAVRDAVLRELEQNAHVGAHRDKALRLTENLDRFVSDEILAFTGGPGMAPLEHALAREVLSYNNETEAIMKETMYIVDVKYLSLNNWEQNGNFGVTLSSRPQVKKLVDAVITGGEYDQELSIASQANIILFNGGLESLEHGNNRIPLRNAFDQLSGQRDVPTSSRSPDSSATWFPRSDALIGRCLNALFPTSFYNTESWTRLLHASELFSQKFSDLEKDIFFKEGGGVSILDVLRDFAPSWAAFALETMIVVSWSILVKGFVRWKAWLEIRSIMRSHIQRTESVRVSEPIARRILQWMIRSNRFYTDNVSMSRSQMEKFSKSWSGDTLDLIAWGGLSSLQFLHSYVLGWAFWRGVQLGVYTITGVINRATVWGFPDSPSILLGEGIFALLFGERIRSATVQVLGSVLHPENLSWTTLSTLAKRIANLAFILFPSAKQEEFDAVVASIVDPSAKEHPDIKPILNRLGPSLLESVGKNPWRYFSLRRRGEFVYGKGVILLAGILSVGSSLGYGNVVRDMVVYLSFPYLDSRRDSLSSLSVRLSDRRKAILEFSLAARPQFISQEQIETAIRDVVPAMPAPMVINSVTRSLFLWNAYGRDAESLLGTEE